MTITELYGDDRFNNLLVSLANKKRISDFDDFRQDVFLEIIDTNSKNDKSFKSAANRVADRYYRSQIEDDAMMYAYTDDNGSMESEEEVLSRLVFDGKARKL